ncbi:MAG: DUF368 domain-containing protein [Solirubrobacteraceae bacterium]|nr:DUF368 domain-containing protein [Solirubrobacteraceae bacterium]
MRTRAFNALRGAVIGCAEVVPGISGGTVALVLGIYERLLSALGDIVSAGVALVRKDGKRARALLAGLEWSLLLPLVAGMAVAVLIGAAIIPPLIDSYPRGSTALFFGLILGSLVVPWRMARERRPWHWAIIALAAIVAFVVTGFPEREVSDVSKPAIFGAAAIAICALALPGASGSYVLLALGLYEPTLNAVNDRDLAYVAVFGAGAVTGLALFARVLTNLLANHRDITVAAMLGLMIGSLRALWPWSDDSRALHAPSGDPGEIVAIVAMALLGVLIVRLLLLVSARRAKPEPPQPEPPRRAGTDQATRSSESAASSR